MDFCVRFLKQGHTAEELIAECKRRGATGTPLFIDKKVELAFVHDVQRNCLDTVLLMSLAVLHDTFGFGHTRANRFKEAMNTASELLADDCINWDEIRQGVKEQLGIDQVIRWNGQEPVSESQKEQRAAAAKEAAGDEVHTA